MDHWNAGHYKKNSSSQFQLGMSVIDSLQLKIDETVLDVGCGDGRLTAEIAARIFHGTILGIDISANMIQEARQSFCHVPNVSFECIDAIKFSAKNKFDRAISLHAFHWIEDQLRALKNIYSALKPGGHFTILMLPSTKNPISEVMESPKWSRVLQPHNLHGQSPETIRLLLDQCGFVNIDACIQVNDRVFKNQKELCDWLTGWVPHATGLAEDKAQELIQDMAKSAKHCDGNLVCAGDSLHVRALKPPCC